MTVCRYYTATASGPPADQRAALEEGAVGKDVWIVGGGERTR